MSKITRNERGDHVYVVIAVDAIKSYAEEVAPFIYADYDADDNVVGFSANGPAVTPALKIFTDWNDGDPSKRPAIDKELKRWEDLVAA